MIAVIVTYNRLEMLKQCLPCLLGQSCPCDILVVDNASEDGTQEYLSQRYMDQIQYFNTGVNLGGAGGFHIGMRKAVEYGYRYVWIMDDDCFPDVRSLEKLMEADQLLGGDENYGFLSSCVLWKDGKECVMNRQRVAKDYYRHIELLNYGILSVVQATFVSLLIPAKTIRRFGLPYKEYFIWGDDIEYTRRIAMIGRKPCYLVGQSRVVHAMKQNIGSDVSVDELSRMTRYRLSVRNEFYTYHQQGFFGICLFYFRCFRAIYRICTKSKDHRLLSMKTVFAGIAEGILFRPKVEYPTYEADLE